MTAAAEAVSKITPHVDYLIVNGGYISEVSAFNAPTQYVGQEKLWEEELKKSMDTNVTGVLYTINAFLPLVRKSETKKIAVITSGLADNTMAHAAQFADAVPYSISKAAVNLLVMRFAVELKPEGITLLALSPGFVDTRTDEEGELPDMVKQVYGMLTKRFQSVKPEFERPLRPEESVEAMLNVVGRVGVDRTGEFLSHNGDQDWL